jgi:hypothetical protein
MALEGGGGGGGGGGDDKMWGDKALRVVPVFTFGSSNCSIGDF